MSGIVIQNIVSGCAVDETRFCEVLLTSCSNKKIKEIKKCKIRKEKE